MKDYSKVVDVCDQMLNRNPGYYPAVLLRQDAYLHLGMYQSVADDYQRAIQLYPYFGKPYATLIKMYFMFGDYAKIQEILQITEKNQIESDELILLRARWKAITAKSSEDLEESLKLLDSLWQKGWTIQSDIEQKDWKEVSYRRGLILTDLHRLPEAKKAFLIAMEDGEEDPSMLYSYGSVLMQSEEYDEAITYLEKALKGMPQDEAILFKLGWCYKEKMEYFTALDYMKQVREINPENSNVCQVIAEIEEKIKKK